MWRYPKVFKTIMNYPLAENEFIKRTNLKNIYSIQCEMDGLYIMYNKEKHFASRGDIDFLNSIYNTSHTLLSFNAARALFDNSGWIINTDDLSVSGAWGIYRVAGLLPTDYDPYQ